MREQLDGGFDGDLSLNFVLVGQAKLSSRRPHASLELGIGFGNLRSQLIATLDGKGDISDEVVAEMAKVGLEIRADRMGQLFYLFFGCFDPFTHLVSPLPKPTNDTISRLLRGPVAWEIPMPYEPTAKQFSNDEQPICEEGKRVHRGLVMKNSFSP
jgi:hypothetical protein